MKISQHIENANKTLFSFEILPPLKGTKIHSVYKSIDPLMEFDPAFIDVTYHREEYVYKKKKDGSLKRFSVRKRPGTVGICTAIKNHYNVDTVPHLICGGFTKEETENALIDLDFLGIDNVLVLRGDATKGEAHFKPEAEGHRYASELLEQVNEMNKGIFLDEDIKNSSPTDFCIGVAAYPEKHFEAPNLKSDLKYLKKKVDAGADYIVTQLFYDNQKFFDFVKKCRDIGINVPIIPGLKPISTLNHLTFLPQFFHIDMPEELVEKVQNAKSNKEIKQIGVDWCIKQCEELVDFGVPVLHFYSMGKGDNIYKIAKSIFG